MSATAEAANVRAAAAATKRLPPNSALSELDLEILDGIYTHRLLTTSQVQDLHAPALPRRTVQRRLARLEQTGYLVRVRGRPPAYERRWFLSGPGATLVEDLGSVQPRPYRMDAHRAVAAAHLLAVNQVGVALIEAARRHGDDFGVSSWTHEVAHTYGPGQREVAIADASFVYDVHTPAGIMSQWRLLELDRGTEPVHRLVAKLRAWAAYAAYQPARRNDTAHLPRQQWRRDYPVLPGILFVFADIDEAAAERRTGALAGFLEADPLLVAAGLQITATTLGLLRDPGPFAEVFWRLPTLERAPLHRRHTEQS